MAKSLVFSAKRMSPFEGKPWSVYLPQNSDWWISAETGSGTSRLLGTRPRRRLAGPRDIA